MFTDTKKLKGLVVRATDGELGEIDQLYFDDESWAIRYFTVKTGNWLDGKQVLISPYSVLSTDWQNRRIDVSLSMKQVQNSPDIDTRRPVSRQHEIEYLGYYGYPNYWGGTYLWGPDLYPGALPAGGYATPRPVAVDAVEAHLRSTEDVTGYGIEAVDGEIGHVDRFVVEEKAWAVRYVEVATKNWWPGKKVLVSPAWVERVSWADSKVYVALTRNEIQTCPEYADGMHISREYENRLHFHYGRPPYWLSESKRDAEVFAASAGSTD